VDPQSTSSWCALLLGRAFLASNAPSSMPLLHAPLLCRCSADCCRCAALQTRTGPLHAAAGPCCALDGANHGWCTAGRDHSQGRCKWGCAALRPQQSQRGVACCVCTMTWSSRTPASTAPAVALCLRHSCYHRRHTPAAPLAVSPPASPP
jgi:hypothetical protein